MNTTSNILVVSEKQEDIANFRSKSALLRNVDSIISASPDKAIDSCKKNVPDTIIFFATVEKNDKLLKICKLIRADIILKNIPILFIFNRFDQESILSSFDVGINDFLVLPASSSEVLMRVIWCLQKNEMTCELEKKESLLKDLGVINRYMEAYTSEFILQVFSNEIKTARKYKYSIVFMAISPDSKYGEISYDYFAKILKKSTRTGDVLGIPKEGTFYILLPKTGINGAYAVYERIKKNIGINYSFSAGISELIAEMNYEGLKDLAENALDEAVSKGGNVVVVADKSTNQSAKKITISQKDWLSKIQSNKKNYESFKQEFSEKINTVIAPEFHKMQDYLRKMHSSDLIAEQNITDTKCHFLIKNPSSNSEASLKIIDPGNARIIIFFAVPASQINKHLTMELKDLFEENTRKLLEDLYSEFIKSTRNSVE